MAKCEWEAGAGEPRVVERPNDIFAALSDVTPVIGGEAPVAGRKVSRLAVVDGPGGGHMDYVEFDEDFVAIFPRLNFTSDVPLRFADSQWLRMHFRLGGQNTTFFDREECRLVGAFCNLLRLPDGMVATEMHAEKQVNWLTVFCRPDFVRREFGLDDTGIDSKLRAALSDGARDLVLENRPLPALAWRLLADLEVTPDAPGVTVTRWQAMVTELVCILFEQLIGPNMPGLDPITAGREERIRHVRELIAKDLASPPTIAALARAAGTNRTTLTQSYRAYYGCSIFETIQEERMMAALRMLLDDRSAVGQVADKLGYASTAAFSFAFKKYFGIPPSEADKAASMVPRR